MATKMAPGNARKRKSQEGAQGMSSLARKRQRVEAIRAIPSQGTDAALSATGELDVAAFVKAREFEINALEKSMQQSRHGLATRAFQRVPRNMRRRTASHNVKKVPRRLRRRAEREMREDNTPTVTSRRRTPSAKMRLRLDTAKRIKAINGKYKGVRAKKKEAKRNARETDPEAQVSTTAVPRLKKNELAEPPKATSKFKKRQIHKTWLPTHLWHAKRAHMPRSSMPLWRMAIPLSPTEKSFRPTHRASGGRGAVAWDMSYMATIGCVGVEPSLVAMLKAIAFGGEDVWGLMGKRWRKGTRSATGWAHEGNRERTVIGPIAVVWEAECQISSVELSKNATRDSCGQQKNAATQDADPLLLSTKSQQKKRRLLLRVHPSSFHQLWTELVKLARLQDPSIVLEDLRFEIASVEITGPGSTEALCAILQPARHPDALMTCSAQTWTKLSGLTNPASLPVGAMLNFNVSDPRLIHPRGSMAILRDESSNDELTDLIVSWPPDTTTAPAGIFSHEARRLAAKALPSHKAINRRKSHASIGKAPSPEESDPQIPVMVLASRPDPSAGGAQGKWTVLMPWKCLDAIWRCLMYYPLNSGGTPRFGGLDQMRQIVFERNEPWFPADFPGTEAGKAWERTEAEQRFNVWQRKPLSRRVNYESLNLGGEARGEHGSGWTCDWEFLLGSDVNKSDTPSKGEGQHTSSPIGSAETGPVKSTDTDESKDGALVPTEKPTSTARTYYQLSPTQASTFLNPSSTIIPPPFPTLTSLATIRITLLTRGNPSPCARIYRLPCPTSSDKSSLRSKWLALDPRPDPRQAFIRTKKIKTNWRGDAVVHTAYDDEQGDIDAINYRPPDMVPEAIAEVEKRREDRRTKRERFQQQKRERKVREQVPDGYEEDKARTAAAEREALMRELMTPTGDEAKAKDQGDGAAAAPACPGRDDLIGFVTSGGYNLRVGRGTAIGAVWVQRLLEGWSAQADPKHSHEDALEVKKREREKRLCIVRNSGEILGRLGIWEVCG